MYHIKTNNNIIYSGNTIYNTLNELNALLSDLFKINEKNKYTLHGSNNNIIDFEYNDIKIKVSLNGTNQLNKLNDKNLDLFPLFIFDKNKLLELNEIDIKNIKLGNPKIFMEILTYKNYLMNPYYVLKNLFNVKDEMLYQIFILYLNNTIKIENDITAIKSEIIIKNFIDNDTDIIPYNNLFKYYLAARKIYPFMIRYEYYNSKFNTNNSDN